MRRALNAQPSWLLFGGWSRLHIIILSSMTYFLSLPSCWNGTNVWSLCGMRYPAPPEISPARPALFLLARYSPPAPQSFYFFFIFTFFSICLSFFGNWRSRLFHYVSLVHLIQWMKQIAHYFSLKRKNSCLSLYFYIWVWCHWHSSHIYIFY